MNGQQRSEQNLATLLSWMVSKTDDDFRGMVLRDPLSRWEIARECGFAKSVLLQNLQVKDTLKELDGQLREPGVMPAVAKSGDVDTSRVCTQSPRRCRQGPAKAPRIRKRLPARGVGSATGALDLYRLMDNLLCSTGRLPR